MSLFTGQLSSFFDEKSSAFDPVALFIVQLVIIVCFCRFLAFLFSYLKQPPVIAEVVAGILLGPSAFSSNATFSYYLFNPKSVTITGTLNVFANIGLIAFMFLVGLELDPQLLKRNARNSVIISITAMIFPFALGIGSAALIYDKLIPHTTDFASFLLFVAVALSITAFPVLARILAETHMLDDKVGNIALSSAAVDDVVAWCLLALVVAIARAQNKIYALYTFLTLVGFILFMIFVVRRLFIKIAHRARRHRSLNIHTLAFMLICTYSFAWFTEVIGVHAIFGAFLTGVITPRENRFAINITERIEDFVVIILLPLYFTYSGLRTDLATLNNGTAWGLTILVIVLAMIGKIGGATLAARFTGSRWRESFTVGVLMSTKGLVELIVLNLGLTVGVLTTEVFTMFVVMALVTTFTTTPLVHFIYLRHRDNNTLPKENYNLVMFIPDQKSGMDMVTFAKAIGSKENPTMVKAIFMNEINDRPSSYFFQLSNKLRNDVPFFKDKAAKDMLHGVKKFGKQMNVDVSTKDLNSSNMYEAVKRTAGGYSCDLLMFGINSGIEKGEVALMPSSTLASKGMNGLMDLGIDRVVGSNSPVGEIIQNSISAIHAPIGVFISKTHGTIDIKTVAFYCTASDYENLAFDQILKMSKEIKVSIYTTVEASGYIQADYDQEKNPNIGLIPSANPVEALLEAHRETPSDLVVLGAPRGAENIDAIHIAKEVSSNVLVIFPLSETQKIKRPFRNTSRPSVNADADSPNRNSITMV